MTPAELHKTPESSQHCPSIHTKLGTEDTNCLSINLMRKPVAEDDIVHLKSKAGRDTGPGGWRRHEGVHGQPVVMSSLHTSNPTSKSSQPLFLESG